MPISNPSPGEHSIGARLVTSILFNLLGQVYVTVLSLAVVPFVVHRLGVNLYGLIAIVVSLGGFGGLMNFGIGRALAKSVSELYWKGDLRRIRDLFQAAWTITLIASTITFVCFLVPRDAIERLLFHESSEARKYTGFALVMTAFGLFFTMITEALTAIPTGLQRFDLNNRISMTIASIRQLGSVAVLALGFHIRAILIVYFLGSLVMFAMTLRVSTHLTRLPRK